MYIGGVDSRGYHHLLWEIVDNSVDEVINGFARRISVTIGKDGRSVTVEDDGRGIPTDFVAKYKKNALELILCTLHAGGKFEHGNYLHWAASTGSARRWSTRCRRSSSLTSSAMGRRSSRRFRAACRPAS